MVPGVERTTPHKLALCVLLHLYASPRPSMEGSSPCELDAIQVRQLQMLLTQAIKRVDSIVEPVLLQTCSEIEQQIDNGSIVADYLRNVVFRIHSPDDLFDLLQHVERVLHVPKSSLDEIVQADRSGRPSHIEKSCVFGVFLRRVLLSCKISFESLSRLFHEVGLYRQASSCGNGTPGITPRSKNYSLKRKAPTVVDVGVPIPILDPAPIPDSNCDPAAENEEIFMKRTSRVPRGVFRSFISRRQLQYHLHCMAEELESRIGVVSSEQIEEEVSSMLNISPDLPRAHFVRYLNCLMHREYQGAVDSLHTYFDYCTRPGGPTSATPATDTRGAAAVHASATLGRRRPMMQYAVLNLAALHFEFGHRRESMLAIQETVRVAQQNGDHVCVVLALTWLFRLASSSGGQETSQLLRRSLARAKELGLHNVQGLSQLVTAQFSLLGQSSIPTALPPVVLGFHAYTGVPRAPAKTVWQALERGNDISLNSIGAYVEAVTSSTLTSAPSRQRQISESGNSAGMPDIASRAAIAESIRQMNACVAQPTTHRSTSSAITGRSLLIQSVAWDYFGHSSLSWLSALSHLNTYSGQSGTSDTCLAVCKLATTQATTAELASICPVEKATAYGGALALLQYAKDTYKYRANNMILLTMVELLHTQAAAEGNALQVLLLGSVLRSLTPVRHSVSGIGGSMDGEDLPSRCQMHWAKALARMGRLTEAHALARTIAASGSDMRVQVMTQQVDLLLSDLYLHTGTSGVTSLPYILRCLSGSKKNSQETVYATAAIKLAQVQLRMGYVERTTHLLNKSLPHILVHGSLELKGQLHLLQAQCRLTTIDIPSLSKASYSLEKALKCYSEACSFDFICQVLYLIARVHDELAFLHEGEIQQNHILKRENAAQQFIQMRQDYILRASMPPTY